MYFVIIMIVTFMSKCIRSGDLAHLALYNSTGIWIITRFRERLKLLPMVLLGRIGWKTLFYCS